MKESRLFLLNKKNQHLLKIQKTVQNVPRAGNIFAIIFNAIVAILALIVILVTTLIWREILDFNLLLNGQQTRGQVIALTPNAPINNEFLQDIELTFTTVQVSFIERNRPIEATSSIPDFIAETLTIGKSVDIFYDPENPRHAIPIIISPPLLIITGIAWLFFIFPFLNIIRILRRGANYGIVITGEVLNSANTFGTKGNPQTEIWYKFMSPRSRQDIFGDYIGKQLPQLPAPGTPVAVMYYNDRKHKLL
ncbi:MAG: hypothetical protein CUN56_03050 [Phototrophicales bacterium]|nr:MAG: hypothetical protein CUN56_03050 [Phototrophicales bacterium]RMG72579.1 MAG: hypothetical protein D6711_12590 [Chloroflexota bacterium]